MDITEVARRSGVRASALRYYEERGLISSTGRSGLRRVFDPDVLERLALVSLGQAAGFTLEEIARVFAAGGRPRIDRALVLAKAEELEQKIRRLTRLADLLRHVAACPARDQLECPTFRRMLRFGARRRRRVELPRGRG